MGGITWLHLSDWHQRGQEFDRKVVRDGLMKDIGNRAKISSDLTDINFVFVTGDIAFSGRPSEYDAAVEHFFEPLMSAWGIGDEGWNRLYVVPGNHDMDRSEIDKLPSEFPKSLTRPGDLQPLLEVGWKREAMLTPFSGYYDFVKESLGENAKSWQGHPAYSYVKRLTEAGKKVAIVGLNTALFSSRNKGPGGEVLDYGFLALGESLVYDVTNQLDGDELVIALMHHPLNWLVDFDRDTSEERLCRSCHFVLHGHQHLPRVNVYKGTLGDMVVIPGGASYERRQAENPRYTNSYNFVHLDFDTGQGTVYLRRWSEPQSAWVEDNEVYKAGRFQFTIPKSQELLHPSKEYARQRLIEKYSPVLRRRFCEEVNLEMKQALETVGGIELVRHEVIYQTHVSPGPEETIGWETFGSDRVLSLIKAGKVSLEPYKVHYFKINGQNVLPLINEENRIVYRAALGEDGVTLEYKYTIFLSPDDLYLMRLYRFTNKFRFKFQRDGRLEYDLQPIGGFPPTELKHHDLFEYDFMETEELCLPDQGYLIRWYRPIEVTP
jgi:hypothetical protein